MSSETHIVIIGAGLAGLALAQCLRREAISFEIFERDTAENSRQQGWAIGLSADIVDELTRLEIPVQSVSHLPLGIPAEFAMFKPDGKEIARVSGVLRVNRAKFRNLLTHNITVQWDKTLSQVKDSTAYFTDGTSTKGSLIVGADGVHSKVRDSLFRSIERKTPLVTICGEVALPEPGLEPIARSGYLITAGALRLFVGMTLSSTGEYYWILTYLDNDMNSTIHWTENATSQELHDHVIEMTRSFDSRLTEIVKLTKSYDIRSLSLYDVLLPDMPDGRVTLIGDSAHAMVPHRGEGGNHALLDAFNLVKAIKNNDIQSYHEEMQTRGRGAVERSRAASCDQDGSATAESWRTLAKK